MTSMPAAVVGAVLFLLGLLAAPAARAQDALDIAGLYDRAINAMQAKQWEEGLKALEEIVQRFGPSAKEDFGPRFGGIYYSKGICEFELRKFREAADSFKKCYEDFPNDAAADDGANRNPYHTTSLFRWAAAEQYAENFEEALELFTKFRDSNPEEGSYSEAAWFLSMGICSAKIGNLGDAESYIGKAFSDADRLGASPRQLMQGFRVLAEAWINADEPSEEAPHRFLDQHQSRLNVSPWDMASSGMDAAMLRLGADAAGRDMHSFAIRLFNFVPKTSDVVKDLSERAANYPKIPPKLQSELDKFQAVIDGGDPLEIRTLTQVATSYDRLGDQRAGYVIYDYLANNYPKSKFRPDLLYGAAAMASRAGEPKATQWYGTIFLREFPDHERRKDVAALMVGHLFQNGQYEEALDLAREIRRPMAPGSEERDMPDFIVGGSLYYLARFDEAQPELDSHVETYPKSAYHESARYHQAANLVKLLRWDDAAAKLDKFIEDYPQSDYMDVALLDRANCHFARDEYGQALECVAKLRTDFEGSPVLDSAMMLEGDIHQFQENYEKAREVYLEGYALAETLAHEDIKANALSQLVGVSMMEEKFPEALEFYDRFEENHAGSYYEPVTVVTAMPALADAGRTDEGLQKLEEMIVELGADPNSENLEKAVNTYSQFYAEYKDPASLVDRLTAIERQVSDNIPLVAWLTMARIDVLEDAANKDAFPQRDARIEVLYQELASIPKDQLANYILMKVGRNLAKKGRPEASVPWFSQIIDGPSPEFKDFATLGIAESMANSKDPARRTAAVDMFKRVLTDFQTPELQEEARLGLGRLHYDKGEFRSAIDDGFKPYMDNKSWQQARAEVNFKLGRSFEELKEYDNALYAFMGVVVNYPGTLEYSAESWYRAAKIQDERGKKEDAFELVNDMVKRMGHLQGHERDAGDFITKAMNYRDSLASELGKKIETAPLQN